MSLPLVVPNIRYPDWLWRTLTKTPTGSKRTRTQSCFFQSETLTLNSSRSLDYERGNESIFHFTDLFKPIETYIYAKKKYPFASYPAAKHTKHSKFAITDIREKPVNFCYCSTRASTLVSAIILPIQVPLEKFPFLFIITIPCNKLHSKLDTTMRWTYVVKYSTSQSTLTMYVGFVALHCVVLTWSPTPTNIVFWLV